MEANFIPQARLLRLLQMINDLKSRPASVDELASRYDTSQRTVYRYMILLEAAGFTVEQDFYSRYFIIEDANKSRK